MAHYPLEERLAEMPVPFLGVVGLRDPLVSVEKLTRIFHSPADMELVYQFDAAHAINYSHPDALARIVHAYLEGHPLHELADGERIVAQLRPGPGDVDR
jgi:pimeloyl-ACP methyl ester carboxylesterase